MSLLRVFLPPVLYLPLCLVAFFAKKQAWMEAEVLLPMCSLPTGEVSWGLTIETDSERQSTCPTHDPFGPPQNSSINLT